MLVTIFKTLRLQGCKPNLSSGRFYFNSWVRGQGSGVNALIETAPIPFASQWQAAWYLLEHKLGPPEVERRNLVTLTNTQNISKHLAKYLAYSIRWAVINHGIISSVPLFGYSSLHMLMATVIGRMVPTEMLYSCRVMFISHAMAVISSACAAQPIEHQPINVGATACVKVRMITTCGAIAARIRIGKVPAAWSSAIME